MNDNKSNFKELFKKRYFDYSISIIRLAEKLRSKQINWIILDQLIRSATSIGANIVEGGNSSTKREFINYFQIALKSSSETLYWLALLKEINPIQQKNIDTLMAECTEIKKLISTIILNTKGNSRF